MTPRFPVAAWLLLIAVGASAAEPERDRIAAERAAAKAKFAQQDLACRDRFVVAPCLEAAKREQQQTLARLHRQELQLDDAKRHAQAAARLKSEAAKARAPQARASDVPPADPKDRTRTPPQPRPPLLPRAGGDAVHPSPAEERRNEAKYESRARAAQAHREAVERRNAERAAKGKLAKPLPLPDAASAPR